MNNRKIIRGSAAEHKYLGNRDAGAGAKILSSLRHGDEIRKLKERIAIMETRILDMMGEYCCGSCGFTNEGVAICEACGYDNIIEAQPPEEQSNE